MPAPEYQTTQRTCWFEHACPAPRRGAKTTGRGLHVKHQLFPPFRSGNTCKMFRSSAITLLHFNWCTEKVKGRKHTLTPSEKSVYIKAPQLIPVGTRFLQLACPCRAHGTRWSHNKKSVLAKRTTFSASFSSISSCRAGKLNICAHTRIRGGLCIFEPFLGYIRQKVHVGLII